MYSFLHTISTVVLAILAGSILSRILNGIYVLYFHPLSGYPGPKLWLLFPLATAAELRGRIDFRIRDLHQQYGDVVRIGSDSLSFICPEAWKDIYGHGHPEIPKSYLKQSTTGTNIIHADAASHARFRKAMLPAFSDRALGQQEPLIQVYVDLLVRRLKEMAMTDRPVDMVRWYQFTTFDLIGDLAYGESLDGLKSQKSNEWVDSISKMLKMFPIRAVVLRLGVFAKPLQYVLSSRLTKSRQRHLDMTRALAMKRINNDSQRDRGDIMDFMMRSRGVKDGLTDDELVSNAHTIMVAGSETTATLLCAVTYYLLQTPYAHERCVLEVRNAFSSSDEIDFKSASTRLPYMLACLEEALRLFPPVPIALPRKTLAGQTTPVAGLDIPPNTLVGVHQLSAYHSEHNFHDARAFHPERWLPEVYNDPSSPFHNDRREAFKPFSDGPRNCIGRNLAYHEMRLVLANVLWSFDLGLADGMAGWWAEEQKIFALWAKPPLMVEVRQRRD